MASGAVVPGWNQRQLAQNVRVGNNIYHRLWGWQVHELGSNLALAMLGQEYIVRLCQCAHCHEYSPKALITNHECIASHSYSYLHDTCTYLCFILRHLQIPTYTCKYLGIFSARGPFLVHQNSQNTSPISAHIDAPCSMHIEGQLGQA